jgi:hypothetical protein
MTVPQPRPRLRKPLDAGPFQPEIGSFRLHLAAEGKAAKTVRIYTEAVQWYAAAQLVPEGFRTRWDQVDRQDVQRWMVWLASGAPARGWCSWSGSTSTARSGAR